MIHMWTDYETRLLIFSGWFSLIRPNAIASMIHKARPHLILIFFSPRIVWFCKPKDTSRRPLIRSTAVRLLYSLFHLYLDRSIGVKILRSSSNGILIPWITGHSAAPSHFRPYCLAGHNFFSVSLSF